MTIKTEKELVKKVHLPNKTKHQSFIDAIDESLYSGVRNGVFHLYTEDKEPLDGRSITVNSQRVINFGSCSYMGLETDPRLKQGVIDALNIYGTQFSSSRAYLSSGNYLELEDLMAKIFDAYIQISATVTLGHFSNMPLFIEENDAVILDQRVHASVQVNALALKPRGIHVELLRHNRMDLLEERIKDLRSKHNKIFYCIDGVYSMFGNLPDIKAIEDFQKKYPQFYLYADDAHGMSWTGKHGRGYVLSEMEMNEQTILVTGCAKGFGVSGGVLVYNNKEMARKIRTCGNSLVFSGPINPPMIGALIASAKIHLSDEIYTMQDELKTLIDYANSYAEEIGLPVVMKSQTPILFIAVGKPKTGYELCKRLIKEGFYLDLGIFPGVPIKNTGLRITITRHHSKEDIKNALDAVKHHYPLAFEAVGENIGAAHEFFGNMIPDHLRVATKEIIETTSDNYVIEEYNTIQDIPVDIWNQYLGGRGTIDWSYLEFLESAFKDNPEKENNWEFIYLIVKDKNTGTILAMTYFTVTICKDDMLSPSKVSAQVEQKRTKDKYYLASKSLMMGSLLSEGLHLYYDRKNNDWKKILKNGFRTS